jgi:hypothetical protein
VLQQTNLLLARQETFLAQIRLAKQGWIAILCLPFRENQVARGSVECVVGCFAEAILWQLKSA